MEYIQVKQVSEIWDLFCFLFCREHKKKKKGQVLFKSTAQIPKAVGALEGSSPCGTLSKDLDLPKE